MKSLTYTSFIDAPLVRIRSWNHSSRAVWPGVATETREMPPKCPLLHAPRLVLHNDDNVPINTRQLTDGCLTFWCSRLGTMSSATTSAPAKVRKSMEKRPTLTSPTKLPATKRAKLVQGQMQRAQAGAGRTDARWHRCRRLELCTLRTRRWKLLAGRQTPCTCTWPWSPV
jgi:hypothetical protein